MMDDQQNPRRKFMGHNPLEDNDVSLSEADAALYGRVEKSLATPRKRGGLALDAQGNIPAGKFQITATGLALNGEPTLHEWIAFGTALQRLEGAIQWVIGDWIVYGEAKLNQTYEQIAERVGFSAKTLREYAYVARNVDMSIRMDALSFGHHQLVTGLAPVEQSPWLEAAVHRGWSISQMRKAMRGDTALPHAVDLSQFDKATRKISQIIDRVGGFEYLSPKQRTEVKAQISQARQWLDYIDGQIVE